MDDPFRLQRFVDAQDPIFAEICAELGRGRKTTHWMWFVFPQLAGLGRSRLASEFAISSLQEATAYLNHPILGPRLRQCTRLVNRVEGRSIEEIFGYPDDLKFHSCMTLFAHASPDNQVFKAALTKYFAGEDDPATIERLPRSG
jgi:uncharacterized protein (DUF1810 family)